MNNNLNVLLLDDHPIILETYTKAIFDYASKYSLTFKICSFSSIESFVIESKENNFISNLNLAILDIRMPKSENNQILSGEDVGLILRQKNKNTRILIITSLTENFRLSSILDRIDPEGLIVKSDLDVNTLLEAIHLVLNQPPFYSRTILNLLRKKSRNKFEIDDLDKKILYEISLGTKMKVMDNKIPLSIPAIEKRKRNLRLLFDVANKGDGALIGAARKYGYL